MFSLICGNDLLFSDHSYTAAFYVETENGCFPSPDWTDFPQTVLEWWSGELKSVNTGSDRSVYIQILLYGRSVYHSLQEKR